ncbi:hypothetical protein HAX54_048520 [Datura stramonium]|uniref:DCD domain-containing protein n=1 Tax=Datura stramonium TaxID=4076 RepID=A0ABS8WLH4_DATST|nr:hypothetical protein [Datura stramonium]
MRERRRIHTFTYSNSALASPYQANNARGLRNLPRDQLGGVIFGCTDTTIKECLGRQLFGLPRQHISYVKNINPGLPVFLFNYNDKTIHGIFEAASSGQMHINPYAWTSDGSGKTPYPAQVQIRVRLHCEPLPENKFKPIILDNYYTQHHFCFELDLAQSSKLISQLSSLAYAPSGVPYNPAFLRSITRGSPENDKIAENGSFEPQDWENKSSGGYCQDALDEKEFIYMKLKQLALERERSGPPTNGHAEKSTNAGMSNNNDVRIDQATFLKPQNLENKSSGSYCQDALNEKEIIYMKLKQLALERERSGPPTNGHAEESTNAGISNNNDVSIGQEAFLEPQDLENKSSGSYCQDALDEKELIYMKLKQLALAREGSKPPTNGSAEESTNAGISNNNDVSIGQEAFLEPQPPGEEKNEEGAYDSADDPSFITQLLMKELKAFREEQTSKISGMEKKLMKSCSVCRSDNLTVVVFFPCVISLSSHGIKANTEEEIKLLKSRCSMLESTNPSRTHDGENVIELDDIVNNESIILAGGYDGDSWLSALDSYSPSNDVLKSLKPMSSVRSCFAIANLSGELYVFGGLSESMWYDTVESYNLADNKWTAHPRLNKRNGNLSGATLKDKIFAIGGGNGIVSFSEVEMYDPQRFALAAAELNGALYAVGGYDGVNYLATAERFDPREHAWTKIESMSTKRGSHVLVPLREKLYAVGGYNGSRTVPSIEIYDPRRGSWMIGEPMNYSRGYPAAAVLNESIYVIGGQSNNELVDVIERYKEGQGWQTINSRVVGKRVLSSAIVLEED